MNKLYGALLLFMFFQTLNVSIIPNLAIRINDTSSYYSLTMSIFSLGMFIGGILLGKYADKINRKKLLMFLIPLYSFFQMLTLLITDDIYFLMIRFLSGFILSGVVVNCIPLILENVDKHSKIICNFTVIGSFLVAIGTMTGGFLADKFNYFTPILIQFILSFVIVYFLKDLKVTQIKQINKKININKIQKKYILINVIYGYLFFLILQYARYKLVSDLMFTPSKIGYISAYTGLFGLLIGLYINRKINENNKFKFIFTSQILIFISLILSSIVSISLLQYLILFTFIISMQNLFKVPMNLLLVDIIDLDHKGYLNGINNSLVSLGTMAGTMSVSVFDTVSMQAKITYIIILVCIIILLLNNIKKNIYKL